MSGVLDFFWPLLVPLGIALLIGLTVVLVYWFYREGAGDVSRQRRGDPEQPLLRTDQDEVRGQLEYRVADLEGQVHELLSRLERVEDKIKVSGTQDEVSGSRGRAPDVGPLPDKEARNIPNDGDPWSGALDQYSSEALSKPPQGPPGKPVDIRDGVIVPSRSLAAVGSLLIESAGETARLYVNESVEIDHLAKQHWSEYFDFGTGEPYRRYRTLEPSRVRWSGLKEEGRLIERGRVEAI